MNRILCFAFTAAVCLSLCAQNGSKPITNNDVVAMTKAGLKDQTIILAIEQGPTQFDTSPKALIELKTAGVSDSVLSSMLSAVNKRHAVEQPNPASKAAAIGSESADKQSEAVQKKAIKDPVEYAAYTNAIQQTNTTQKAQFLENFVQSYPNSVMKEDALVLLMVAYQQANDGQKALDAATHVLQSNPNNIRALALLAYNYRALASQGGPQMADNLAKAKQYGQQGLQALQNMKKPDGTSDVDFTKLHNETGAIFDGAVGFAALQAKDFPTAQKDMQEAVSWESQPNIADIYPLATADLEANPINPEGFWFLVKAAMLAQPRVQGQLLDYGRKKYIFYHGSDQGWTDLMKNANASQDVLPPPAFTVIPSAAPGLTIRVLEQTSIPYEQKLGGGISTSCTISGGSTLRLACNSYDNTVNWPHVLNVMLVEASDGIAYIIACDRAWAWSKCVPLQAGLSFEARRTDKGLAVRGINAKGKESEPTYAILQSKTLR